MWVVPKSELYELYLRNIDQLKVLYGLHLNMIYLI